MSVPKNWPSHLPYLTTPLLQPKVLSPSQISLLQTKPASSSGSPFETEIIPSSATLSPCPLVRIQPIHDAGHPANGQFGLFAARDLKPGTFIVAYLGRVHPSSTTDPESDYDLWLDRDADLAVDASREGNEARFVNDYRGVKARPNAEFGTAWCERWRQLCVGFWVVGHVGGKGKQPGIRKGEEILVSYGKGFWGVRMAEADADAGVEG